MPDQTQNKKWEMCSSDELKNYEGKKYDIIVINTFFKNEELLDSFLITENNSWEKRIEKTKFLIENAGNLLKNGGLLFVYGLPRDLPYYAKMLNAYQTTQGFYLFKYWISLEFEPEFLSSSLPNSHIGMLMYLKTKSIDNPTPFQLNTKFVRIPYRKCSYCGLITKDWGGKKHLLNKLGSAISDIWYETQIKSSNSSKIPLVCLDRIHDLAYHDELKMLVIEQESIPLDLRIDNKNFKEFQKRNEMSFNDDKVFHADSLELMRSYVKEYPEGLFDLVFADPPYNLAKDYSNYSDEQAEIAYISWCNEWLNLMSKILRPGGALFVLNIPKWAIYHAEFLTQKMEFRNWIVWDALGAPSGKFLPAHYALLYYTKPGGPITQNYDAISPIDSRGYCLRNNCIKVRKQVGNDETEPLTDIWHDVHRIKHKKDRDSHPCQLPLKLMNRIIEFASNPGDWVFDPFGGAGTTAISAKMCGRHFIISDIDEKYRDIALENLKKITVLENGEKVISRSSVKKNRTPVSKKEIQMAFFKICEHEKRVISLNELKNLNSNLYCQIKENNIDFKYITKITNRRLENEQILNQNNRIYEKNTQKSSGV